MLNAQILLVFALFVITVFPIASNAAQEPCTRRSARPMNVSSLVDKINDYGLVDQNRYNEPWPVAKSPFADWYIRSIVAMGTTEPPTVDQLSSTTELIRQVRSIRGVNVEARIWSDATGSTVGKSNAVLARLLCVTTLQSYWKTGSDARPTVEVLMARWLASRAALAGVEMRDPAGFVDNLSKFATVATKRSNHALNILVAAIVNVPLDRKVSTDPSVRSVPYYDDGKVQGIKVKTATPVSVYLFTGNDDDLLTFVGAFHGMTDPSVLADAPGYAVAHWKSILRRFEPTDIGVSPVEFAVHGRRQFSPALRGRPVGVAAYGTTVATNYNGNTGLDQGDFVMRDGQLRLSAVSGVEGTDAPMSLTYDMSANHVSPLFTGPALLYYVVDDDNGLILSYAFQRSWR